MGTISRPRTGEGSDVPAEAITKEIDIEASPRACFEVITDYESYPQWQPAIVSAEVLEKDKTGRGKVVRFGLKILMKSVTYTLEYHYEAKKHAFSWKSIDGDLKHIEGSYRFEKNGEDTHAVYTQAVDPGFWIPGKIVDFLSNVAMFESLKVLKDRVEKAAAKPAAKPEKAAAKKKGK